MDQANPELLSCTDVWTQPTHRVLLAEDDDDFRGALAFALRNHGYEVIEASSGEDVFAYLESAALQDGLMPRIHALVTDLRMPDVSGMMILERLVSLGYDLPTIMITAFSDAETRVEASELGVHAFLAKPFEVEQLEALLDDLVREVS